MLGFGSTEIIVFGIIALILFARTRAEQGRSIKQAYQAFPGGVRYKPRFSLKDLMASTGLIALGFAWIAVALLNHNRSSDYLESNPWLFVIGSLFIAAGILNLFKRS